MALMRKQQLHVKRHVLRIEFERKKRGWRTEDLAHYARVPGAEISRIENGHTRPYPRHAARPAAVLKIRPEKLTKS
jgi:transcriptional regulator with XRE-family HTH domain